MCQIISSTWGRNRDISITYVPSRSQPNPSEEKCGGVRRTQKMSFEPPRGECTFGCRFLRALAHPPGEVHPRASRDMSSRANDAHTPMQIDQRPSRTTQETTTGRWIGLRRSILHAHQHPVLGCTKCTQCTQFVSAKGGTYHTPPTQPPSAPHPVRSSPPICASNACLMVGLSGMHAELGGVARWCLGVPDYFINLGTEPGHLHNLRS